MRNIRLTLLIGTTAILTSTVYAGPLTEARVTRIVNKVIVTDPAKGAHPAALDETIKDQIELKTGVKSRSELLFQDQTLTRIGPETSFRFKAGTREMSLEKGTMLLQVPKGLGGAEIRTASVTAAITGTTILMEYTPSKHIKVLVLEGSLRLSVNGRFGDSVVLRPGRMVLMRPDAKKIPPPVSVDLKRIVKTSSLVNMSKKKGAPLPSIALIENEIAQQTHDKGSADLVDTGVVIRGSGTTALNSTGTVIDVLARNETGRSLTAAQPAATPGPASTPDPTPGANPSPTPAALATPAPTPNANPSATPAPTATPGGDSDDEGDDGHGNKGKHKGQDKDKKKPGDLRVAPLPPSAVDRARLSPQETISPATRSFRNEH
ncbi:MAG: hypothetical protein QOE26_2797 [Verrucomicrobiota bacterium]|jgi:hypothetical protein